MSRLLEEGPIRRLLKGQQASNMSPSLPFWLDRLTQDVNDAKRDEEDAIRVYDKLRVNIAAVFSPGTVPYEIVKKIGEDEKRHYQELNKILDIIKQQRP